MTPNSGIPSLNDPGFSIRQVPVSDLLLDLENPRIRLLGASNQAQAVAQIYLTKGEQLYRLARDICENGLTLMPIVTTDSPSGGSLVVKDGNRRVAALKLLRQPELLPDKQDRQRFLRLQKQWTKAIPDLVTVYHSNDLQRIGLYIDRLHTGTGLGEGQLEWSAVEKALFEFDQGRRGQNELAARLLRLALTLEIPFGPEFPITNLTRLVNIERLQRLGIRVSSDGNLEIADDKDVVAQRLRTLIGEVDHNIIHVRRDGSNGSIYSREDQEVYLATLLERHPSSRHQTQDPSVGNPSLSHNRNTPSAKSDSGLTSVTLQTTVSDSVQPHSTSETSQAQRGRAQRKDPYDRKRVISRKEHQIRLLPHTNPPDKVRALLVELRKLRSDETPIAAGLVIRTLLELATVHCLDHMRISHKRSLAENVKQCAQALKEAGVLNDAQKDAAILLAAKDHFLSISGMHKVVHNPHFPTNNRTVHQLWDQARPFIEAALNQH